MSLLYEEYEEYEDYGSFYKVYGFSGECKFWSSSHGLSNIYKELYDKLVPFVGEADTKHGELLRMISRLVYDIFNNGLCNDKTEELNYILAHGLFFCDYLENQHSMDIIRVLISTYGPLGNQVEMNQDNCDALDDITQAIVKYAQSVEHG